MSTVMEMWLEATGSVVSDVPDEDLRDASTTTARRPLWYAAVVGLDALAIAAFITWVVIPRLT